MLKKILFVVLLSVTLVAKSQERKFLYGCIRDSIGVISNAHILNLNSQQGTISLFDGTFKIFANPGDTIAISSIQYQEKKYLVRKTSFGFQNLVLYLNPKIYQLEEIKLKRHHLKGSLSVDVRTVPNLNTPTISAVSLALPNAGSKLMKKVDREVYTATTSASGISLDLILNTLSGRLKKLKFKKSIVDEDENVNFVFEKYKYLFEQSFNIKKEDAFKFLYFSFSDSLYNEKLLENEFALIHFLQKKSNAFHKRKQTNKSVQKTN
jgi:hypothetical protein